MKTIYSGIALWSLAAAFFVVAPVAAQRKAPPKIQSAVKPVIFAVLQDGKWIEPIAVVEDGELAEVAAADEQAKAFENRYYKPKSTYPIIFGGGNGGSVSVVKSNIGTECGGSTADVTSRTTGTKLTGLIMALATNVKLKPNEVSYRVRPALNERTEVEKLVRSEFTKNGATAAAVKNLRYHNLTAVDIQGDDVAEYVGSYWIAPTANERRLLFFIAERKDDNILELSYSDHSVVKADDLMSGEVKDVESGLGAELLIDVLDYDDNGVREIFTIGRAFEGNNYYVYKNEKGKWTKVFETYAYRCAY